MAIEVFIAMIFPRRTAVRLLAAPIAFLALQQMARADMVYVVDGFSNIGIYYGSAQLFSPGGTLLSTTYAMTVETTVGCQQLGVAAGEELTYDYNLYDGEDDAPCLCGTARCRGSLYSATHLRKLAKKRAKAVVAAAS